MWSDKEWTTDGRVYRGRRQRSGNNEEDRQGKEGDERKKRNRKEGKCYI